MVKFSIVDMGNNKKDIVYLLKEIKMKNLICATEKDEHGDTVYSTYNIAAVKKIAEDYDGLMIDIIRGKN